MAAMIRRLRQTETGAELIEMAIVTPLLLILLFGIAEFGFVFQRYVFLTNAAAEGARVASLPGYVEADVKDRVAAYAAASNITGVSASSIPSAIAGPGGASWPGSQVTVTYVYSYQFIGPLATLVGGSVNESVTLTARSTVRHMVTAAP
jgi:Flp pilus assembly protein TadG